MGKIVLLDDLTINQIAAGEVIERPASVVKELVENAIDAGAKNITVETKNGGIESIRVTDDGCGIAPDDMEIAFERHATSKIRKAEDLEEVKTMGFRGEALASIAAISKLEMVSKTEDSDTGYKVEVTGGDITDKSETGAKKGTTITVNELFYNTPVRYKFLKKDFTEAGYIEDAINRISIANPDIAITLINNGRTVIQTSGNGNIEDVIYNVFGKEAAQNIIPVDYTYEDMRVTGVIGKPILNRSSRANQMFYVNHRYVKDKTLTSATEQGFKGLVMIGKHPFAVLNLDVDPKKIDVNVHPTKLEIRFQEEGKVFKAIYHAIKETLLKSDLITNPDAFDEGASLDDVIKGIGTKQRVEAWGILDKLKEEKEDKEEQTESKPEPEEVKTEEPKVEEEIKASEVKEENFDETKVFNFEELSEEEIKVAADSIKEPTQAIPVIRDIPEASAELAEKVMALVEEGRKAEASVDIIDSDKKEEPKEEAAPEPEQELSFEEKYKKLFGRDISVAKQEYEDKQKARDNEYNITPISDNEISLFEQKDVDKNPPYKFIGIAFKTYIILTKDDELYMLDQHAAHERIMFERVKENFYNEGEKDSQLMLLPDIIELSNKEMGIFRDNIEMFKKAGFEVEEFGDNTVKLTGVPEFCLNFDTKEIFLETLDEIDTVARTAKQEIENKFLATIACKAAVKAHMALTKEEVDSLMAQLLKLPNPFSCPHGRPTIIKMSKTDIEKKFHRIQN